MFTIYRTDNGQIIRVAQQDDAAHGEASLEGEFSGLTHYAKGGVAIEIPPPPGDNLVFDHWLERWVPALGQDTRPIIERRNRMLADSDWTQIPDSQVPNKAEWAAYRQALRDITNQPGFPLSFTWPAKPENVGSPVLIYNAAEVQP